MCKNNHIVSIFTWSFFNLCFYFRILNLSRNFSFGNLFDFFFTFFLFFVLLIVFFSLFFLFLFVSWWMFAPNSRILDEIVMLYFPFDLKLNDSS